MLHSEDPGLNEAWICPQGVLSWLIDAWMERLKINMQSARERSQACATGTWRKEHLNKNLPREDDIYAGSWYIHRSLPSWKQDEGVGRIVEVEGTQTEARLEKPWGGGLVCFWGLMIGCRYREQAWGWSLSRSCDCLRHWAWYMVSTGREGPDCGPWVSSAARAGTRSSYLQEEWWNLNS